MTQTLARIAPLVAFAAVTLAAAGPSRANDPDSVEAAAAVKDGEAAQLDLQTITRYGETTGRFEVFVAWADTSRPVPQDYAPRRVRYMVNCQEGTITLAAVGVIDQTGQVRKMMVAPPRSIDPVKPEKGTQEAKWVQRVCMF